VLTFLSLLDWGDKLMNIVFPVVLASAMAASLLPIADALPKFSIAPGCKAAAALNRSIDPHLAEGFQSCMDDEEAAHARLLEGWATYPADAKTHCLNQIMHDEDQSYVGVLECLHLALGIDAPTPALRGAKKRNQKSQ
jgi:hypothetical protein